MKIRISPGPSYSKKFRLLILDMGPPQNLHFSFFIFHFFVFCFLFFVFCFLFFVFFFKQKMRENEAKHFDEFQKQAQWFSQRNLGRVFGGTRHLENGNYEFKVPAYLGIKCSLTHWKHSSFDRNDSHIVFSRVICRVFVEISKKVFGVQCC